MNEYAVFAEFYDAYMESFELFEWYSYIKQISGISCFNDMRVLDLGCGSGNLGKFFIDEGAYFTGVDISSDMLAIFEQSVRYQTGKARLIEADMREISFFNETFDFIYCAGDSINYLDKASVEKLVADCYALLKNGGIFTVDLISNSYIPEADDEVYEGEDFVLSFVRKVEEGMLNTSVKADFLGNTMREEHQQYLYDPQEISALGKLAGFDEVKIFDFLSFDEYSGAAEKYQAVFYKN